MKVHEFQAKNILKEFGVPIPDGGVATTPEEARAIAERLNAPVVVKAQIHAGGRGKGGGIQLAQTPEEAEIATRQILGNRLVTPQTGAEGRLVRRVLVEEAAKIERELYAGVVLDRGRGQLVCMVSAEGGVEIETVAARSPEKILKEQIDPAVGLLPFQRRRLAFSLGLAGDLASAAGKVLASLCHGFSSRDCSLVEINPLIVTSDGRLLALDAKMNFDDNALYRQPSVAELRDVSEEEPLEVEASQHNLSYIKLDGDIGCMVNGAGLAMATMDLIKLSGGSPANFLDVGGAAKVETVRNGFRILMSDSHIKGVLINIFGGIVRCDRVARGVVEAVRSIEVNVPVVVRLEGTNAEEGQRILRDSALDFIVAANLKEAAEAAVKAARDAGER